MHKYRLLPAVFALAITTLAGCKDPAGIPNNDVRAATTHTIYCTTNNIMHPTGHLDLYQDGPLSNQCHLVWDTTEITRAYNSGTYGPYPRKVGLCVFHIPAFNSSAGIPACTLYYYQDSHSGAADLLVNAWWISPNFLWPPYPTQYYTMFYTVMNSTDTLATDSTRTNDGNLYKVPLSDWGCQAIADSGAWHYDNDPNGYATFFTGWVYSGTSNGTYTGVSGTHSGNPPYIKVVYDD